MRRSFLLRALCPLLAMIGVSRASAEPSLTVMRDCATVAELQHLATSNGARGDDCRSPGTRFERGMASAVSGITDIRQCFLARVPSGLAGWSCVQEAGAKSVFTLTCWEVRDEDDAAIIRAEYDRYGPIVATYLQDANRCSTSNRDAASTGFELWTTWRSLVTNGPVTFAEKLKSHRRVPDILIEGYALIKPDSASSSGRNMHYIILGANWLYRQPGAVVDFDPVRSDGPWVIDSGDRDPGLRRFTQAMSARVPPQVRLSMSALEIKRTTIRPRSDAERRALLDRWREVFAESLDYQDYDRLSDARFRRMTGMDWDDIREKMLDALPPEQRHNMESRLGDEVIWFMKEGRSCEGGPNMVAGVMTIYADPNDPSSYGQLIFYGSAGSTCLNEVGRVAREQERALKAAIAEVEREIRRTS